MYTKPPAVTTLVVAAALVATGMASAGQTAAHQRIAIVNPSGNSGAFTPTPPHVRADQARLGHGDRLLLDRAAQPARRPDDRDRQPTQEVRGQARHVRLARAHHLGRFRERYRVGTGKWKIVHGTGAYAHLEGHGCIALLSDAIGLVAGRAEGLVDLRG